MRRILFVSCLALLVLLIFGCGRDDLQRPDGTGSAVVDDGLAKSGDHDRDRDRLPQFNTIYWPPPAYPVSVMKLDRRTGSGTPVATLDAPPAPPGWVGEYPGFSTPYGLAYDVDGTVYSLQNWFDAVPSECFSQLVRIDLATGAMDPIGPVHNMNFAGPEFDAHGNLYATGFTVGPPEGGPTYVWGDSFLYRIDKRTGEKTRIGDTGHTEWMDLDFDSQGRLWGTFGNDLYTLDTETGASEFVTHIYGVQENRIPGVCEEDWQYMEVMGIAFDHRDVLWATAMKGFSLCEEGGLAVPFMSIDTHTGVATLVGSSIIEGQSHGGDIPPRTVKICHNRGNDRYVPLEVSLDALPAHLAHGDFLPGADGRDCGCREGHESRGHDDD